MGSRDSHMTSVCDSLLAIQSSKQCSNSALSCSRSFDEEWESLWRGERG